MDANLIIDVDNAAYKFAQSRDIDSRIRHIIEHSFALGAYYMYNKLK